MLPRALSSAAFFDRLSACFNAYDPALQYLSVATSLLNIIENRTDISVNTHR